MRFKVNFQVTDRRREQAAKWLDAPPELWGTPSIAVICCGERVGTFRPPKPQNVPRWVQRELIRPWVLDGNLVGLGADERPPKLSRRDQRKQHRWSPRHLPGPGALRAALQIRRTTGKFVCASCKTDVPFRLERLIDLASELAREGRWDIALGDLPAALRDLRTKSKMA